jgi:hypothetical protein
METDNGGGVNDEVAPDRKRFLVAATGRRAGQAPITGVLNWTALRKPIPP